MFIKPYRPVRRQVNDNYFWLERDLDNAPQNFVTALKDHFKHFNISLIPVIKSSTSVSFKYVDSNHYIVRDIGYASVIMTSLLDVKINGGFMNKIDAIVNKLSMAEQFMDVNNRGLFYKILSRTTYNRSIIVGMTNGTDCIDDIEYIEFCYDNKPNVIPSTLPLEKKYPIRTKRTGVKLKLEDCVFEDTKVERTGVKIRLYLKPEKAEYLIKQETINCINDANISFFDDISSRKTSDYILESTEHHLNLYYEDINGLFLAFLNANRKQLSTRLGYQITHVDEDIRHLIDMALF